MNLRRPCLIALLAAAGALLAGVGCADLAAARAGRAARDDPWRGVPRQLVHTEHAGMFPGPIATPQEVTRRCLECHPNAAKEVMATSHWTWLSDEAYSKALAEPVMLGKRNAINDFCISIDGNWPHCTSCHAGYGWRDKSFDFTQAANVDCLVCHDQSGQYFKDPNGAGYPAADVDLRAAAESVGRPTRRNCGACHFAGGGGDAVKHGDLDGSMVWPAQRVDVHMGRHGLQCVDCHSAGHHDIRGRLLSVNNNVSRGVACTKCHIAAPHADKRLNDHLASVSCQACHIPQYAVERATKMTWDWSAAGKDLPKADPRDYLKIKGAFTWAKDVVPFYYWYNGQADRYVPGDQIDPSQRTQLSRPQGSISDPRARIFPFKTLRGDQPYDVRYRYLLKPKLAGAGGYWTDFNWDEALRLGAEASGLPYSGEYGFAPTVMYWPITHMVAPKEDALGCTDCHGEHGRMDWAALGYPGDPARMGGRFDTQPARGKEAAAATARLLEGGNGSAKAG